MRYQEILAGEFGPYIYEAIAASIGVDFVDAAKGIEDDAAALKTMYPDGPPVPSQEVSRVGSATDRTRGVHQQVIFQSGLGATSKRSRECGGLPE